ncbi:MAG: EamA family transporter [Burkholderiales bacterium]
MRRIAAALLHAAPHTGILRPVLGVFYTFLATITFGINSATVRRGVITGSVTQVVVVSMPIGLAMFAAAALMTGQFGRITEFSPQSFAFLASAGVVHFVMGRYCGYRSIQAMGANLASPVQQWSLLVTLTLAIVYLNETLDVMKIFGIALMVLGPSLVVGARRMRANAKEAATKIAVPAANAQAAASPTSEKPKFKPKLAQGYFFGILCCFCWGSSPILVRAGLDGTGLALAGGVISYSAALIAVSLVLLLRAPREDARAIDPANMKWFIWIGVTVCLSQIFLYLAMAIAPVTVVQPLMRMSNIFGVIFAWYMNREHEVFDKSVLLAIGLSVIGAACLSIDPAWVIEWLGLAPPISNVLSWKWPVLE